MFQIHRRNTFSVLKILNRKLHPAFLYTVTNNHTEINPMIKLYVFKMAVLPITSIF